MNLHGNTKMYLLEPIHDSRKSFYGKADILRVSNGKQQLTALFSYKTQVAELYENNIDNIEKYEAYITIYNTYSMTTRRHIREFLRQYNMDDEMISYLFKHVGEEKKITIDK